MSSVSNKSIGPPHLAERLLYYSLDGFDRDFVLGDFEEIYSEIREDSTAARAGLWYWRQVVKSLPHIINNLIYWSIVMLLSYLKIALRYLIKNKVYSIINVLGLGVAIAVSITGYINYQFSQSYDKFHENRDQIYALHSYKLENGERSNYSYIPQAMAPIIQQDIPGIRHFARLSLANGTLRYGDQVFNESLSLVDEDFLEMFTFPLLAGSKDFLKQKNAIALTDETARKYFGDESPIGKQMTLGVGAEQFEFLVQAVLKKPPRNSSIQIEVVLSIDHVEDFRETDLSKWSYWSLATFIQTDKTAPQTIERQLGDYVVRTNEVNPRFQIDGYGLTALPELAFTTRDLGGSPFNPGMHPAAIAGASVIALLVLLLACFNFVNTAIAFAARRLKEIGIRKVVGGVRGQLIKQFLGENIVLCLAALILGLLLAEVFVPAYDGLWPEWSITLKYAENIGLLLFIVGLLLFTAIAAGAYPAFYVSSFNATKIFRGKQELGGTNALIRVLLTLQFAISMAAIIAGFIMNKNAEYIRTVDLGFEREQILIVRTQGAENYGIMKNAIEGHPGILGIAGSRHLVGRSWTNADVESEGNQKRINVFEIGENYFETAKFELLEGRSFDRDLTTDIERSIIVNETLARTFGWDSPLGKNLEFDRGDSTEVCRVIGVVKDFYYNGLWQKVRPTALRFSSPENYRYLSVGFDPSQISAVSKHVEDTWKSNLPSLAYDGFFQDEILAETTRVSESIRLVFFYIAIIVVVTAGMGLFALVALNVAKRTKEIGIRKILGASMINIGRLISREFVLILAISCVIASAMAYFLMDSLLASIWAYYTEFGLLPFVASWILVYVLAMCTVASQVFSVATANPVDAIRDE